MSIAASFRELMRRRVGGSPVTQSGAIEAFRIDDVASDAGVGEVIEAIRRKLAAARRIA